MPACGFRFDRLPASAAELGPKGGGQQRNLVRGETPLSQLNEVTALLRASRLFGLGGRVAGVPAGVRQKQQNFPQIIRAYRLKLEDYGKLRSGRLGLTLKFSGPCPRGAKGNDE